MVPSSELGTGLFIPTGPGLGTLFPGWAGPGAGPFGPGRFKILHFGIVQLRGLIRGRFSLGSSDHI